MRQFSYATLALSTIVLMGLSTSVFAAPKITGRLYASMLHQDTETKETNLTANTATTTSTADRPTFSSGGSRIRFEGTEALNDKLDLAYRLEYNVKLDDEGASTTFTARSTYLGLNHKDYGKLHFGRLYTPDDDIDYVAQGFLYADGASLPFSYGGQRTNNTFQYTTPGLGKDKKTTIKLHYSMDEGTDGGASVTTFANGVTSKKSRDLFVANTFYDGDKLKAGAAYTHGGSDFNALRGMVSYDISDKLNFGVMAQHVDYNSNDNELGVGASVYYKYDKDKLLDFYGQVGFADNYGGFKDGESTTASVGAVKWLKKEGGTRIRLFGSLNYADTTSFKYADTKDVAEKGYKLNDLIKKQTDGFGVETGFRYDF